MRLSCLIWWLVAASLTQAALPYSHQMTGLEVALSHGRYGSGQTIAIIDGGIAWDHSALGGGYGASNRVVGGWDFTEEDAVPYDDAPSGSHGTHVAGVAAASMGSSNWFGVAQQADLVALRVLDDYGSTYFHWVENALRWIHDNRNAFESPITAVNLSIGSPSNSDVPPPWAPLEDELDQLVADGMFIVASAGNNFTSYNEPGLSYPAASPYVVPVMSVDESGNLSYYSQRHTRALAAPGRNIVSTVPDYAGNHNGVADDYASFNC
jgi:subtilisin family serine protease